MKTRKPMEMALGVLLLFLLAAPLGALSATFNVNTIAGFQDALTAASANGENDTINVAGGTYNLSTPLNFESYENYPVTISGAGAGATILDGGHRTLILNMLTSEADADITIQGLTFRNGNNSLTDFGGGLNIVTASAVVCLENLQIIDNAANRTPPTSGSGGGVFASSDTGSVILRNNTITGNSATNDGGGASLWTSSGTILIAGNTFTNNNLASTGGDDGGGVAAVSNNGRITITRNTFTNNSAGEDGGGAFAYLNTPGGAIKVTNNFFSKNTAGLGGGGSFTRSPVEATITVADNTFNGNASATVGGGSMLYLQSGTATLTKNIYRNNTCPIAGADADGAGIWAWTGSAPLTLTGNIFRGNNARRNGGGVDLSTETGAISLVNNIFDSNVAANVGGGVSISSNMGTLSLANNTLYNNAAADGGGVNFYTERVGTVLNIYNTIIWRSTPQAIAQTGAGPVNARYSDIQAGMGAPWFGTGCIDAEPRFVAPGSGDFHLQSGSPCIDAGDGAHAPEFDYDGQPRWDNPQAPNTGVGPPWVDIGADEQYGTLPGTLLLLLDD